MGLYQCHGQGGNQVMHYCDVQHRDCENYLGILTQ